MAIRRKFSNRAYLFKIRALRLASGTPYESLTWTHVYVCVQGRERAALVDASLVSQDRADEAATITGTDDNENGRTICDGVGHPRWKFTSLVTNVTILLSFEQSFFSSVRTNQTNHAEYEKAFAKMQMRTHFQRLLQLVANVTKRLHKFRNRYHFHETRKRIYEKTYYSHASSVASIVTPVFLALLRQVSGEKEPPKRSTVRLFGEDKSKSGPPYNKVHSAMCSLCEERRLPPVARYNDFRSLPKHLDTSNGSMFYADE
ncbi:hypothetical protein CLF_111193 [Clonorchis sinensis]|uniref:Uncharacterized protein n=1 Tax=Clonorchis sinensis TaxID=79923 RepID=G7YUH0_CLOSI|nr:hypothetical protein CLF_111193 [Clonorchis sinensis]